MGNQKAFLEIHRKEAGYRPVQDRIHDFSEVEQTLGAGDRRLQASRCMDCGVPFCHWACPLGNKPPEWNDALYKGEWEQAYQLLTATNPFPEFTGRVCPALCEKACVLNLMSHEPTTNREDEAAIVEGAFREGFVPVRRPVRRLHTTGPHAGEPVRVAVIGAGPAGLAAADELNQRGFTVTVFEKNEVAGGLLRYGIPNFKLNKAIIDRRIHILEQEGIEFRYNSPLPTSPKGEEPWSMDALYAALEKSLPLGGGWEGAPIFIATGTPTPRDLPVPGRQLKGVHFALELLAQQNRVLAGIEIADEERVTAKGKDVLVIGGGDTGSDCIGTAIRQGAKSVTQIEIMPRPVDGPDDPKNPWPNFPRTFKTTSSHEEGCYLASIIPSSLGDCRAGAGSPKGQSCVRRWNINTLDFIPDESGERVVGVRVQEIDWKPNPDGGRPLMVEKGKPEVIKADLVLLAMGFLKPEHPDYPDNVFVVGDAKNGASLVVRAMASGKETARKI